MDQMLLVLLVREFPINKLRAMGIVVGWVECNGTHRISVNGGFRYTPPTLHFAYIIFWESPKKGTQFFSDNQK